ncbi:MAG: extracellular solute-binding protein [Lachnospiraceae bacterium]
MDFAQPFYEKESEKAMKKRYRGLLSLFLSCILLVGCGAQEETADKPKDKTISQMSVPGILENCIDAEAENLYYTMSGRSVIYQYTMDGTFMAEFAVTADEEQPAVMEILEEESGNAADLSGLCMYENMLYCFRFLKGSLMAVDTQTGESTLCVTIKDCMGMVKMAAGAQSLLILQFGLEGKELWVFHTDTGTLEKVPVKNPLMIAHAGENTYWIEVYDEEDGYLFQEYNAETGELSEKYRSNFTYELDAMSYSQEEGLLYGKLQGGQYVRLNPRKPEVAARFEAKRITDGSHICFQMAGGRLYVESCDEEMIYHWDPAAFITENQPLKGYVTSEYVISDWAGYNVELEVISWEELALKVLAEDKDYDFVIMSTDMAEAAAIRDAMAYAPIPKEYVETYWQECHPFIREAATYNGDIWMLPLQVYARGLIYHAENLAEYDIYMEDIKTIEDLCKAAQRLYDAGQEGRYELLFPAESLLQEYLWKVQQNTEDNSDKKVSFDTPEFCEILDFMAGEYGEGADFRDSTVQIYGWEYVIDEDSDLTYEEQYEKERIRLAGRFCMEELGSYSWAYEKYAGAEGFRACPMPGMTAGDTTVQVSADILIINPNTSNLEETLNFVRDMSEAYIANQDRYLSANQEMYPQDVLTQDILGLYSQGRLVFRLPQELFTSYWYYCQGRESDRESVIKELNRTVSMYYGE